MAMFWKKFIYYLNPLTMFRKRPEGEERNINTSVMHGINRLSILIFLVALVFVILKFVR